MNEIIEAVLNTEAEGEAEMLATLIDASEEQIELAKAHYRLQTGFSDKVSSDLFAQISKTAYPVSEPEDAAPDAPVEDAPVEDAPVEETEPSEEIQKALSEKDAEIAELRKTAENLQRDALKKSYVAIVEKEFKHVVGMSVDEMADLLMDLRDVSQDMVDRVTKTWVVGNQDLLATAGSVTKNDGVSGAFAQIEKAADELVKQEKISKASAIARIAKEKPELYRAYKEEQRSA